MRVTLPIREKHDRLTDPYVTAGNRLYIIGSQNGQFPDGGDHIAGEMNGVWDHPIKLIDAFYVGVTTSDGTVWPSASAFRAFPFYTEHDSEQANFRLLRRQFIPDDEEAAVITIEYTNQSAVEQRGNIIFALQSDLRPGWLSDAVDGQDIADQRDGHLVFSDSVQPWAALVGTSVASYAIELGMALPTVTNGRGASASLSIPFHAVAGEVVTIGFVIAGSILGVEACQATLERVLAQADALFAEKHRRYEEMAAYTDLSVPDEMIAAALPWVKFNTDWLVRQTPLGIGLGAGLPEYPWWFGCDNGYALEGALSLGWFDLAKETVRLLARESEKQNGDGRIIHEVSTTGVVFNPGNAQETPQFCKLVWEVFRWTGDMDFLREMYPLVQKAIAWTLSQAPGQEDFPKGYGIMEVEGLNDRLIDSAVYTYAGLIAGQRMAALQGESLLARLLQERAESLKHDILDRFWLQDEGLFADVISTPRHMNAHLQSWSERAKSAGLDEAAAYYHGLIDEHADTDEDRPYLLRNWVISTPLEQRLVDAKQAQRVLSRMRTAEFAGAHGLYLNGTDRQAIMTISTGVQAMAEAVYGQADEAVRWIRDIAATLDVRTPGAISEMSPDWGCFVQAWTAYGVYSPIVTGLFGIAPAAHEQACTLTPQMPSTWERASLAKLRIGGNTLDFRYQREAGVELLSITTEQAWTIRFAADAASLERGADVTTRPDGTFALAAGSQAVFRLVTSAPVTTHIGATLTR